MRDPWFGLCVAAALCLAACAPKLHPYELDEAHIGAPGVKVVGLLPLNALLSLPPEFDGAARRVYRAVRRHLLSCGVEIVHFSLGEARSLWNEGANSSRADGPIDGDPIHGYVQRLHAVRRFDVLVVPSLVYREGRIRYPSYRVGWDGVERKLQVAGYVHTHGSIYLMSEIRGKMPAVSLHLAVHDARGEEIFDSFGGIDLVHEVDLGTPGRTEDLTQRPEIPTWDLRLRRDRLTDLGAIREGVAMAFTPYMDPGATPAASADPLP